MTDQLSNVYYDSAMRGEKCIKRIVYRFVTVEMCDVRLNPRFIYTRKIYRTPAISLRFKAHII